MVFHWNDDPMRSAKPKFIKNGMFNYNKPHALEINDVISHFICLLTDSHQLS